MTEVAGLTLGSELTYQIVGAVRFWTVLEQPRECLGCARAAAGWRGRDPAGDVARQGRPFAWGVDRQAAA
ncbi:hypothetical protein ABZ848_41710 [Streptomyces sp. NPDC047081]|uniref:hypothetical protein n=1 Tax=Streptomyces sp. NPDC047081 TaxID=3154706 RepID=UPI0034037130